MPTLQRAGHDHVPAGTAERQGVPPARQGHAEPATAADRGDQLVRVFVDVPKKLTRRQEELLRELQSIEEENVSPERKNFLGKVKDLFGA